MKEEIRFIKGTAEHYGVSNTGNVYSYYDNHGTKRKIPKLLKQKEQFGYRTVRVHYLSGSKTMKVHRLVALEFIPNPENLPHINHRDENKSNNRVDNLEWCTPKYNNNYGTHREKMSLSQSGDKAHWFGVEKTKHPRYKKICPLVLYTMLVIKKMTSKSICKELNIGHKLLNDRIREYNLR